MLNAGDRVGLELGKDWGFSTLVRSGARQAARVSMVTEQPAGDSWALHQGEFG